MWPERFSMGSQALNLRTLIVAVLTIAAVTAARKIFSFYKKIQVHRYLVKILPGYAGHWLYGSSDKYKGDESYLRWIQSHNKLGSVVHLKPGFFEAFVMATDPDAARIFLTKPAGPKEGIGWDFLRPWLGDGLLVCSGRKWLRNRRLLTDAFHFDILKAYVPIFEDCAVDLMVNWRKLSTEQGSVEVFDDVSRMTLRSLLRCSFGTDTVSQKIEEEYRQAIHNICYLWMKRMGTFRHHFEFIYRFSDGGKRFYQAVDTTHRICRDLMSSRKIEILKQNGGMATTKHLNLLELLLKAKDDDGKGLSDKEIIDEIQAFLFAGHDTTASAIPYVLYNLAKNKSHQQKCREEIVSGLREGAQITWSDLAELPYTTMCIKESLRMVPPVPTFGRILTEPVQLPDGGVLPRGINTGVIIQAVHHNPKVWSNPDMFDPMRFSPENSKTRSPFAFIPFSAGSRNCIGQHFAMNELKVTVATALRNFEFDVDDSKPLEMNTGITTKAATGMWLKMTPI